MADVKGAKIAAEPIGKTFVAAVNGLDLREPLDPEQIAALRDLVHQYGVLVVRGQERLSDDALAAFAGAWGDVLLLGPPEQQRPIIKIGNLDSEGRIRPADDNYRKANEANAFWHIDNTYSEPPAKYSMLLGRIIPSAGGETEFADAVAGFASLPPARQKELESLVALHSYAHSRSLTNYAAFSAGERAMLGEQERPLIFSHPATGTKSLYVTSHIRIIPGMSEGETKQLLEDLRKAATQPDYVYRHIWHPGDLLIYDNRMVMHRAQPYADMDEPRDLSALRVV